MQNNIAIVTSGHPPFDERIFWKFGLSLFKNNYSVCILCSTEEITIKKEGISVHGFDGKNFSKIKKIDKLLELLELNSPDVIICCEALTIIPAFRFKFSSKNKCKIIYDVTEWYPEGIVTKIKGANKYFTYIYLSILNLIFSNLTDAIIIGEVTKKRRYDLIAPFKKKLIIGYYPVIHFFKYNPPKFSGKTLTLCYAGLINFKRGIKELLEISALLHSRHNELQVKLKLLGKFETPEDEKLFDILSCDYQDIEIEKAGWTDYNNISNLLSDVDICFDLRENNFIYNHSLPIKIFEYMACGKPFIFSDVKPIRKELGEISCGFLVNPNAKEDIIKIIELYLSDNKLLLEHSVKGRQIIEAGKNWEVESKKLLALVEELTDRK